MQEVVLTQEDLQTIDGLIKKTPFEYAMPLFQFFTQKIQDAQKRMQETPTAQVDDSKSLKKVK